MEESEKYIPGEVTHASDIYSKDTVDSLVRDPTHNTSSACVSYGLDVPGGY